MPSEPARLRNGLAELDRAHASGRHGRDMAGRRAALLDATLERMFVEAGSPPGVAVCAVGGYGRSQLLPRSDVDLLIVHGGAGRPEEVEALAQRLLYPLWDAGLEVGQAVRTPAESAQIAAERLDAMTAMLDLRYLCGDAALAAAVNTEVLAPARQDPRRSLDRLRDAAVARHERHGAATRILEPDLKDGEGGTRDGESLGWLVTILGTSREDPGLLRARELGALDAAAEFFTRVRSALHLETGKRIDRLRREHHVAIARAMGFHDGPGWVAEDALMRMVFEHGRLVAFITTAAFERALDARAKTDGDAPPPAGRLGPADVLARMSAGGRSIASLDALDAADVPDPVTWTPEVRRSFLSLLREGPTGVEAIETLDLLGLLTRYIPAWAAVRCRPQRDPYHRFTVDTHLTGSLREVDRMLEDGDAGDAVEREAAAQVRDPDAVRLAALLHDIGKVGSGGHVAIGARVAAETLDRMGLPDATRELATFMVAEHLLLPDTATRRDLSDENLVLDVAARVGSPSRLAALYLLAKADALATGAAAWTPWRRTLIHELVGKVHRAFVRGDMGAELAERLAERVGEVRDRLAGEPEAEVERFVLRMPRAYFLAVAPAAVANQFRTIAPPVGEVEARTSWSAGARAGTLELLVVAADRPGLLSWIAGALSLAGVSIRTAQAFTTEDGVAADLFELEGAFEPEVSQRRRGEFESLLSGSLAGRTSLERRVAEKRGFYPAPGGAPVTVSVDNDASEFSTVVEVGAPDRIGLLHDVTSVLAEIRLDVHLAKVATYPGRVIDVFYVRDALGRKVRDPRQVREIEEAVTARVGSGM